MHCASCASVIERTVGKIPGVEKIEVNKGTEQAKISYDINKISPDYFNQKLEPLGYSFVIPVESNQIKKDKLLEIKDMKIKIMSAIPIAIFSFFCNGLGNFSKV